jgi:hypothetical protein
MKTTKKTKPAVRYYTHAHNVEGCLQNGSFVRQHSDGRLAQYMNGDFMGAIDAIPKTMTEVPADLANELLPRCCK